MGLILFIIYGFEFSITTSYITKLPEVEGNINLVFARPIINYGKKGGLSLDNVYISIDYMSDEGDTIELGANFFKFGLFYKWREKEIFLPRDLYINNSKFIGRVGLIRIDVGVLGHANLPLIGDFADRIDTTTMGIYLENEAKFIFTNTFFISTFLSGGVISNGNFLETGIKFNFLPFYEKRKARFLSNLIIHIDVDFIKANVRVPRTGGGEYKVSLPTFYYGGGVGWEL